MVKAINTHIKNYGVCENGCGALWNIVCNNGLMSVHVLL